MGRQDLRLPRPRGTRSDDPRPCFVKLPPFVAADADGPHVLYYSCIIEQCFIVSSRAKYPRSAPRAAALGTRLAQLPALLLFSLVVVMYSRKPGVASCLAPARGRLVPAPC